MCWPCTGFCFSLEYGPPAYVGAAKHVRVIAVADASPFIVPPTATDLCID